MISLEERGKYMSIPKHITIDVDLDWVTFYCPCGSSFCNRYDRDRSETDK